MQTLEQIKDRIAAALPGARLAVIAAVATGVVQLVLQLARGRPVDAMLWFSVLLNVNLALLNLLPFPVLDGGHITLAIVEVIRRRPVSARFLNVVQSACALILIGFMLFIMFFDTSDLVRSAHNDREQPMVFAPKH